MRLVEVSFLIRAFVFAVQFGEKGRVREKSATQSPATANTTVGNRELDGARFRLFVTRVVEPGGGLTCGLQLTFAQRDVEERLAVDQLLELFVGKRVGVVVLDAVGELKGETTVDGQRRHAHERFAQDRRPSVSIETGDVLS